MKERQGISKITTGKRIYGFLLLHNAYNPPKEILINISDILSAQPATSDTVLGNTVIKTARSTICVEETLDEIIQIIESPTKRDLFQKEKEHPQ